MRQPPAAARPEPILEALEGLGTAKGVVFSSFMTVWWKCSGSIQPVGSESQTFKKQESLLFTLEKLV
ncbi:hypothetical protein GHR37_05935 [Achromobacter xylosoxidans]|nr:hypothetical protein [Achromobacter xylosoxidans]